jgi:Uncharacterized conserved protein
MMTEALLATAPTPIPLSIGGHTFRMVPVRGGEFDMGDDDLLESCRPVHRVQLDDFWMGQFPVTQALWRAVSQSDGVTSSHPVTKHALDPDPSHFKGDRRPVEGVLWRDVQVFLEKLNLLLPGWNFRLPTEAEWEYAARGLSPGPSPEERGDGMFSPLLWRGAGAEAYSGSDRLEAVGWRDGNSHGETKPVGLKLPNALGLFDMSGNVWEWCADWYDSEFYEKCAAQGVVKNPRNDENGSFRVLRGGSWFIISPQYCRVASRNLSVPPARIDSFGFRLAASPPSSVAG